MYIIYISVDFFRRVKPSHPGIHTLSLTGAVARRCIYWFLSHTPLFIIFLSICLSLDVYVYRSLSLHLGVRPTLPPPSDIVTDRCT